MALTACSSTPSGSSYSSRQKITKEETLLRSQIIHDAKKYVGVPYKYGGNSPQTGFDCSGLVRHVYARSDISLPRTTTAQAQFMKKTRKPKVGDVLFFNINGRSISHSGIYLGNNQMVHAPSSGKRVEITRTDTPYWKKRFVKSGTAIN